MDYQPFQPAWKPNKKTLYLAGPMADLPQFNAPAFDAAAADLRHRGFIVINPVDLDLEVGFDPAVDSPEDFDLESTIRRDVNALLDCDMIVMLPGHERSKGATAERYVAQWAGIPVHTYPTLEPYSREIQPLVASEDDGGFLPVGAELVGRIERFVEALKDGDTVVNEVGAKQSHISARFDCIPPEVLKLLAQCLGFGAAKYGKDNWRGIPIEDNLAHAMNHINEFRLGDNSEPHLVNTMARVTFALTQAVASGRQPAEYIHPDMLAKK